MEILFDQVQRRAAQRRLNEPPVRNIYFPFSNCRQNTWAESCWRLEPAAIALVSIGAAIGLPLSLAAGRLVSSQLFGVTGTDSLAMVGATTILFGTAVLASYLPARRASRVDPMVALRHE